MPGWVTEGACHSWTRSSFLQTVKPAPLPSIPLRTESSEKIWMPAGGKRVWLEAKGPSFGMGTFTCEVLL